MRQLLLHAGLRWKQAPLATASGAVVAPKVYLLLETGGGGAGRHVLDLYAGLIAAGWNVHLLLSTTRMDSSFEKEVSALPQDHVSYFQLRRSPHVTDLRVMRRIKHQLRQESGAVILHAHSTKAGMVAWAMRGRSACRVFTPHAYPCMDPGRSSRQVPFLRIVEKLFSKPFEGIIAVSEDEKNYTATLGVKLTRIHHIPNGVDPANVRRQATAGRKQRDSKGPVLGFLGRLVDQKNPALFVQTLAEVVARGHDATAIVIGDGPLRGSLQELARALGVSSRMRWLGAVPGLPQLANMDVMLHTSVSESLPYSLLEAVAADVPVVTVCNPGSRSVFGELLPEIMVPCGTPQGLADGVTAMLQDEALRQRCREQYPVIAEQFSTREMVTKTLAVYETALRAKALKEAASAWHMPRLLLPKLLLPALDGLLRRTMHGHNADELLPASRGH